MPLLEKVLIVNGPNLNALGVREPHIYGTKTLESIISDLKDIGSRLGLEIEHVQSNSEGALVDAIQNASKDFRAIVINPGAYTHTSIAIRDAISALDIPVIEVHLSNIYGREEFRKHSFISPVVTGVISGFGAQSYELALVALAKLLGNK